MIKELGGLESTINNLIDEDNTYESLTDKSEDEVIDFETIINEVAFLRNRWLGIMKGLDSKSWMSGHVVRLRTAGMEDVTI